MNNRVFFALQKYSVCAEYFLLEGWLFYAIADGSESFRVADGEFGENFAVKFDALSLHTIDEPAVAETVFASGIVDARNPKCAQVAFAITAIAIGIA